MGQFYRPTKSGDFCMTHDRFLLADFIGKENWPILLIVCHALKAAKMYSVSVRYSEDLQSKAESIHS